jgi:hypothetical protein
MNDIDHGQRANDTSMSEKRASQRCALRWSTASLELHGLPDFDSTSVSPSYPRSATGLSCRSAAAAASAAASAAPESARAAAAAAERAASARGESGGGAGLVTSESTESTESNVKLLDFGTPPGARQAAAQPSGFCCATGAALAGGEGTGRSD